MTAKYMAKQLIDFLPDEATLEEIIYALYLRTKFELGEREIREDKGIPHHEARKQSSGYY